ncbi:MAG TPA: DUF2752 domain-containing protein [Mucilaginibacter sp.]|nr:DUF2752 domain-containing protein [Mucilaginibacter sp.]
MIKQLFSKYFELIFWLSALTALALTDPEGAVHFSLCPLKAMGVTWCPGCGLGHSISWLFRGDIRNSFHAHSLGIPATAIILYRIYHLGTLRHAGSKALSAK